MLPTLENIESGIVSIVSGRYTLRDKVGALADVMVMLAVAQAKVQVQSLASNRRGTCGVERKERSTSDEADSGEWPAMLADESKDSSTVSTPLPLDKQVTPSKPSGETAEAVAGQALLDGRMRLATCVLLGQRALLRPAELCSLDLGGIVFSRDGTRAVLNLGWTKGGQRKGVREGATIEDPLLLLLLRFCVEEAKQQGVLLPGGPPEFQRLFIGLLRSLGLGLVGYTPYSLRRGGATSLMARCGDLKELSAIDRWGSVATARLYVDGAAQERTAIRFTAAQGRSVAAARRHLFELTA